MDNPIRSALIAIFMCSALSVLVLLKNPRYKPHQNFAWLNGFIGIWHFGLLMDYWTKTLFWPRLSSLGQLGAAAAALHFFSIFLGNEQTSTKYSVKLSYILVAVVAVLLYSPFYPAAWLFIVKNGVIALILFYLMFFLYGL